VDASGMRHVDWDPREESLRLSKWNPLR
jgi:hypothetical protein